MPGPSVYLDIAGDDMTGRRSGRMMYVKHSSTPCHYHPGTATIASPATAGGGGLALLFLPSLRETTRRESRTWVDSGLPAGRQQADSDSMEHLPPPRQTRPGSHFSENFWPETAGALAFFVFDLPHIAQAAIATLARAPCPPIHPS